VDYPSFDVEITLGSIEWNADDEEQAEKLPSVLTFWFRFDNKRFIEFDEDYLMDKFYPEIDAAVMEDYGASIKHAKEYVSYAERVN
jgi:hypothetical protein